MAITRAGSAIWKGNLKEGEGSVSTKSGAITAMPYSFNTRFGEVTGTNPEELIGAAHAGCYSMALSNMLYEAGIAAESVDTTSKVTLDFPGGVPTITKAHLVTVIKAPAAEAVLLDFAEKAKAGCVISRALNAEITLEATVA